ncbi:MAG: hypothetical protein GY820_39280 [Gammaproteobacteria bacterium]|nr:hypothetical protein [Gammaproteobacteria bacterium]
MEKNNKGSLKYFIVANTLILLFIGYQLLHDTERVKEEVIEAVMAADQGRRNTAGNGWQLYQFCKTGKIDMSEFPPELKTVKGTWLNEMFIEEGLVEEMK